MAKPKSEPVKQLLYSRKQAAEVLGRVDVSYIRRLEKEGRLKAIRLSRSPTARVFVSVEQVQDLVRGATDAAR